MTDIESGSEWDEAALKEKVQQYLDEHKIKHAQEGYQYLVAAICIAYKAQEGYNQIDIRNQVAILYGTKPKNVERAVRYAIRGTNMTNKTFVQDAVNAIEL